MSREPSAATLARVTDAARATLALDDDAPVEPGQLLVYDLGFTSMDLLDLLFRLEDEFAITIPEGTLLGLVVGESDEAKVVADGFLTERGREALMAMLHDTPSTVFEERIHVSTLQRYSTVAAMARLVEALCSS